MALHEAIRLATQAGDRATAVTAHRELGFVEVQAGRRRTADTWLAKAEALAETDEELAAIGGVRGMNASDMGDYPTALQHLDGSVERAAAAPTSASRPGRCRSWPGRTCCATSAARPRPPSPARWSWSTSSAGWRSCPGRSRSRAELDLRAGRLEAAGDQFEHAWSLACPARRPVLGGHGRPRPGPAHASRGDRAAASAWLGEAAHAVQPGRRPLPVGPRVRAGRHGRLRPRPRRRRPRPAGWSTPWPRWPPAATCASWSSAPSCTAAASATRRRWPRPGCWPPGSTTRPHPARRRARPGLEPRSAGQLTVADVHVALVALVGEVGAVAEGERRADLDRAQRPSSPSSHRARTRAAGWTGDTGWPSTWSMSTARQTVWLETRVVPLTNGVARAQAAEADGVPLGQDGQQRLDPQVEPARGQVGGGVAAVAGRGVDPRVGDQGADERVAGRGLGGAARV